MLTNAKQIAAAILILMNKRATVFMKISADDTLEWSSLFLSRGMQNPSWQNIFVIILIPLKLSFY